MTETEHERNRRERQRVLFDDVAELYDATRRGYPAEIIDSVIGTSGVGPGDSVLEIGCGTGQLTRDLAGRGFSVTAIDIGPTMVSSARRNVGDSSVNFEVTSFEDLRVADHSIDLIVSATAFHWIDSELGWAKAARLLHPRGWLALLSTAEQYDDPLKDVWIRYSDDGGAWATQKKAILAETLAETGLFAEAVEASHGYRLSLPADVVLGVELTRATFLGYDDRTRAAFSADLRTLLGAAPEVNLKQQTLLTMAQVIEHGTG